MSYILDALRRADAERQQGGVPGLHTPARPQPAAPPAPKPWLLWGGAALLLLGQGAVLAWWWAQPAPVVVAVGAAPVDAAGPTSARTPTTAATVAPAPQPLPMVVSAAPVLQTPVPTSAPAPAALPTALPAAVEASAGAPKTVALQQLPAELRRELPPLAVGGSVWSDNPGSRFVILDGQVAHEGDTVAPGLVMERIQPKAAVLRWRGMRLELAL